jgi:2-C-methyl-D-erythritol 2,4-cyclodiphosphate synthase
MTFAGAHMYRIGEGYDIHRLEKGRAMRVGCVEIPCDFGPLGHSDGDVLAHALCDALLGALALGDIGTYFPPTDQRWCNADSRVFLAYATRLMRARGARIVNADATVVLEKPKLAPYVEEMRRTLASILGCKPARVSVKAKTAEKLGPVGEGKAIEARAIVLVEVSRRALAPVR